MSIQEDAAAKLDRLLRRTAAAQYVTETYFPCSPKTLAKIACVGSDGPPFRMAGRISLYPTTGLDIWAKGKIGPLVRSTSELRTVVSRLVPGGNSDEK